MTDLPFPPNPEDAADWLAGLEKAGPKVRAHRLYQSLMVLNKIPLEATERFPLLETLRPGIFATSNILAVEFAALSPPLGESARNTAKLSAFLHHELALGYEQLPTDQTPLAGQRALASLGQMILRVIQLGEPLAASAWRRLFKHYRQGIDEGWLNLPAPEPLSYSDFFSALDQIKCILAFVALTPMRYDCASLTHLYSYLEKHKDQITISDTPTSALWFFDPQQAQGPRPVNQFPATSHTIRYLVVAIKESQELPESVSRRWRHHFDQLSELEYSKEKRIDELWCGWECSLSELRQYQRTPHQETEWLSVPEFEVILPDAPSVNNDTDSDWHRPHRHINGLLKQCPHDSLAILETNIGLRPGDLVGLKLLDETIMMSIIRWARPGTFGNQGRYGLELLEGEIRRVKAITPGLGPSPAIHIVSPDQGGGLLLPQVRLKPGMSILVGEHDFRIAKLLEWSNDFCAYQLAH